MRKLFLLSLFITFAALCHANVITVGNGSYRNERMPICNWHMSGFQGSQFLYFADELGLKEGDEITSLSFYCVQGSANGGKFNVRLKNTSLSELFSANANALDTNLGIVKYDDEVYASVVLDAYGAGDWVTFKLSKPFVYSGQNIIVDIRNSETGSRRGWCYFNVTNSNRPRRHLVHRNAKDERISGFNSGYDTGWYLEDSDTGVLNPNTTYPNVRITYNPANEIDFTEFNVNNLRYIVNDDKTTVSVTYTELDSHDNYKGLTSAQIPQSVSFRGHTFVVTGIGEKAFRKCDDLASVYIPNTVKSIGRQAFSNCVKLTKLNIPSSVEFVDVEVLRACSSLSSITVDSQNKVFDTGNINAIVDKASQTFVAGCKNSIIPSYVKNIGSYAFAEHTGLTSVNLPAGIDTIGAQAFDGCKGLTCVLIPEGTKTIKYLAFRRCSGLTDFVLPASVDSIGQGIIRECENIKSVDFKPSLTYIEDWTFWGCSSLEDVKIPSSVKEIKYGAFYQCKSLKSFDVPETVTEIAEYAFDGCSSAKYFVLPKDVSSIGAHAFSNCTSLTDFYSGIAKPTALLRSVFSSSAYSNVVLHVPSGCAGNYRNTYAWSEFNQINDDFSVATDFTVNGIKYIANAEDMTAVVTYDVYDSQENYKGMTVADIPAQVFYKGYKYNVVGIGEKAFRKCEDLVSVSIPNSVKSIGRQAFSNCAKLTKLNIPSSVEFVDLEVIRACSSLSSITVDSQNKVYDTNNINAIVDKANKTFVAGCKNSVIPTYVKNIGSYAFAEHTGLTSIKLHEGIDTIGDQAFDGCKGLTSVTIPDGTKVIKYLAFRRCSGLTDFVIPASVDSIGQGIIRECENIKSVEIKARLPYIADWTFWGCSSLENVKIPTSVKEIKYGAFYQCKSLKEMIIPTNVVSIGDYAFDGCENLGKVYIHKDVKSLGKHSFTSCNSITDVYAGYKAPEALLSVFSTFTYNNATLHVPSGCTTTYKNTYAWSEFSNIIDDFCMYGDVDNNEVVDIVDVNIIVNVILGKYEVTDYSHTDVDGNGVVDLSDFNTDINLILGK